MSAGEPRAVPGPTEGRLLAWIEDGLLVAEDRERLVVPRQGLAGRSGDGRTQVLEGHQPRDPAGIMNMWALRVTPDGRFHGYS